MLDFNFWRSRFSTWPLAFSLSPAPASSLPLEANGDMLWGMMNWTDCPVVERVPGKVSGAWLFKDTRVPVRALFENLEGGATVEQFLEWFPGVTREQVLTVLKFTESSLAEVVA